MALSANWQKSSYSSNGGQDCVEARWRKSSYSSNGGQNCVEARPHQTGDAVQVRDSTLGNTSPILTVTPGAFRALLRSVR